MDKYFDIFEYQINDKNYIAYSKHHEIKFGIKTESGIDNNLNSNEAFIIRTIYNFIVGDKKDILELSPITFNNENIKVFYNIKNRLYSFYSISNNPENQTLMYLNYIFNNQNLILAKDSKGNQPKNKFKIMVKISGVLTAVFVSTSLVLSSLPIVPNNPNIFKLDYFVDSLYKDRLSTELNENFSYDEIVSIIYANNNLTEKEKDFLAKGLKNEIEENIKYINVEQLKRNLSELKIVYYNKYEYTPTSGNVKGIYSSDGYCRNQIELYGDGEYFTNNFDDCDKFTLVHETNHALNKRHFLFTLPNNAGNAANIIYLALGIEKSRAMEEMVNELFSREYYEDFSNQPRTDGYSKIMPIMYALCEILDENTLRKYKFDSDYFYITNYLESLGIDITYAHDLFKCLELARNDSSTVFKDTGIANNKGIYNIIKYCYETKYGIPMENDLLMMSYFYNTTYVDEEFNKTFRNNLELGDTWIEVTPKGYVSENYKKKHPNVTISIDEVETITITEENRYVENNYNNLNSKTK